jgi:hypothetical protein
VPRLGDHERLADTDDALRLLQYRLDAARILVVARNLPCPLGRLDVVEANDTPLGFGHRLLRVHDDVSVLELELRRDQLGEVVPLTDLRQPFDCDNPDFFHASAKSSMSSRNQRVGFAGRAANARATSMRRRQVDAWFSAVP